MEDSFELPVSYHGKVLLFPAKLVQSGYSYRIDVEINGFVISFERDEEGDWRAVAHSEFHEDKRIDPSLLQSIVDCIDAVTE